MCTLLKIELFLMLLNYKAN